jgi:Tat protein secretion system quality control protein TatD with DNase activity
MNGRRGDDSDVRQVVKIRILSMRRASTFLNTVAFKCAGSNDYAFMMPAATCLHSFGGNREEIQKWTENQYDDGACLVSSFSSSPP